MLGLRYLPPHPTEVVIAALNEEEGVGVTISEVSESIHPHRILLIDGHSHDRTVQVAKDFGAEILIQDGKGKGDAMAKAAKNMSPEAMYLVMTDADYTYPAEYLPEMIEILENNPGVGMVCGNRFNGLSKGKAFQGRFYYGNKLLAFAHNFFNGVNLQDPLTGLRVIRAEIFRNWKIKSKGFDIEVELNHQVVKQGFRTIEVPIGYRERLGEKKLKMKDGATILKRILAESLQ
jgi:glycosyltransferase involved in cell wall biosynthesis